MQGTTSDTVYGYFEETARARSNKAALVFLGAVWSFGRLQALIEGLAASLYEMGLRKGERAVMYMPNLPQWVITWLATMRLGVVPVPISPIYTPTDVEYLVNNSGAETIFCVDTNFGYVEEIFEQTCLKRVIVTTVGELLPMWKRLLGKAFDTVPKGKYSLGKTSFPFKRLLRNRSGSLPPYAEMGIRGEDLVEMLYTGGTTGFPKGVPFSNLNLLGSCLAQRSMSESVIPKGEDIVVQGAPLFHALGQALAMGGILAGDTCILLPRVHLDGMLDHIERYKAKTCFGVPALYRMILEHKRVDNYDIGSLKYCFCAGDVLPKEIEDRWTSRYHVRISQGYGATETCGGVALTPADAEAPEGSCGLLLPFWKASVVDPLTLAPVPGGESGELIVSSKNMIKGYWKNPEETARCFIERDSEIWYRTSDIVRMDENNWVFFMDRSVDTIKHKGYRIAASEIEAVLQGNPAVVASCVVGIPDKKVGERIKAFVVLKEDVKGITGYDLISWCRKRLPPYKIPQYIEFRDMLPMSKVGKLLRREVRDEEQRRANA